MLSSKIYDDRMSLLTDKGHNNVENGQTMIYKTQCRKLKIEQHNPVKIWEEIQSSLIYVDTFPSSYYLTV
jgi:hypothetical protein